MAIREVEPEWHRAHTLAHEAANALPIERVEVAAGVGRVVAQALIAPGDLPGFDSSAMDGWVVAGKGPWRVRGQILAGGGNPPPLAPGEAARIATGGAVPPGSRGILRSEHGRERDGVVSGNDDARPGEPVPAEHVRPAGEEARAGAELIAAGTKLDPIHVGLAAHAGIDALEVRQVPRVALAVLGDELATSGRPRPGQVRDALGPQLPAIVRALGGQPLDVQYVPDTLDETCEAIGRAGGADAVWTTGGSAHGPVDHIHPALAALGAEVVFDTVAMRPGHPLLLARLPGGTPVVALPGNPLSAIAGIVTAGWPVLRGLLGQPPLPRRRGRAGERIAAPARETRLVPVTWHGTAVLERPYLGSGMLRGVAGADAFALVPPGGARLGDELDLLPLPW